VLIGLTCAVAAALAYGGASVVQAAAARRSPRTAAAVRDPRYVVGLGADALAWLLSLVALRRLPVYEVQAVLAGSLAVTAVLARFALGLRLGRRAAAAVVVTVAALAVLVRASANQAGPDVPLSGRLAIVGATIPVLVLTWACTRGRLPTYAAAVAGLAFAGAAVATSTVAVPAGWASRPLATVLALAADPAVWAVAVYNVVGVLMYAEALRRSAVGPATAVVWVVEVAVPTVVGVVFLHEGFRPGWAPAAALGLAAATVSAVVLARSQAL
jgi:drug/metabolite transporter (DMT)-like permease